MAAVPPLAIPLRVGASPFSIGSVIFSSVSGPSSLAIGGGEQKMAVTELVGGGKVVYATGFQPTVYEFGGTLYQPEIDAAITTLRRYAVDGKERLVTWRSEKYYGIVKTFPAPVYSSGGNKCAWRIGLEVTRDANGAFSGVAPKPAIDDANTSLIAGANTNLTLVMATVPTTNAATTAALNAQLVNLNAVSSSVAQAKPTISASLASITAARTAVTTALTSAQSLVASFASTHPGFVPSQAIVTALTVLAANLRSVQFQNVVQQQGGSMYVLAATRYGDITRVFDLMTANGSQSPRLDGSAVQTVILPPFSATK